MTLLCEWLSAESHITYREIINMNSISVGATVAQLSTVLIVRAHM